MKLLQLNVWQGFVSKKTIDLVNSEQPDIMCAQEVMSSDITIPHFSNATIHQQLLNIFSHHYFVETHSYIVEGHTVQFGNAIYSKKPIIASNHAFTAGQAQASASTDNYDYNVRNILRADIQLPSGELSVYTHHGYHSKNSMGDEKTIKSHTQAANFINTDNPIIFCGDLNVEPTSDAMQPIYDLGLQNVTANLEADSTLGKLSHVPVDVFCDYIFASNDITIESLDITDDLASDHKALILEFDL